MNYNQNYEDAPKNDVEIIGESRRSSLQYPNHRYDDGSDVWPSQEPKTHPDNIQDVILELGPSGPKGKNKFLSEMLKSPGSSMRLKGVYKQSGVKGSQSDEKYQYSKEINDLMENGRKRFKKSEFRVRGAPFRLPARGAGNTKRENSNFQHGRHVKNHPITIYLDFYPMEKERRKKPNTRFRTPDTKSPNHVPKESINVKKMALPPRKHNGIIMKLNLYPKGSFRPDAGTPRLNYKRRAERKSFGWFSKHKKKEKHPKGCSILGLNPDGANIRAKWKDERGEWVHADHVSVKYLKKGND